jgi:hypothetical protein
MVVYGLRPDVPKNSTRISRTRAITYTFPSAYI